MVLSNSTLACMILHIQNFWLEVLKSKYTGMKFLSGNDLLFWLPFL